MWVGMKHRMGPKERPSPEFIQAIRAGVFYWQQRTHRLDAAAVQALDTQRQNLHRMLWHGVQLPETWPVAVDVLLATFSLAERRGYWQEWLSLIDLALAMNGQNEVVRCVRLLSHKGQFLRFQRQLAAAVATHEEAVSLAQTVDDPMLVARTQWNLVVDFYQQGRYTDAVRLGKEVLAAFQAHSADAWRMVQILRPLGAAEAGRGHFQQAHDYLRAAVEQARTLHQPYLLARTLNDLARALWRHEMIDQALTCFEEAAALLAETNNEFDKVMTNINLGALYHDRGHLSAAENAFRRADTSYLRRSGHIFYKAILDNNLGNVLLDLGKLEEAENYLRQALLSFPESNNETGWGNALGTLAKVLVAQGRKQEALAYFEEAITRLSKYPEDEWGQEVLQELQEAYRQLMQDDE